MGESPPARPDPEQLGEEMKRMKIVEEKRRRDIEEEKQQSTGSLDLARVWEMESFDRTLREDYGDFVDGVTGSSNKPIMTSPEVRQRCLEFSGLLSTLENLTAQARGVAQTVDSDFYERGVKTATKAQEYLQDNARQRKVSE